MNDNKEIQDKIDRFLLHQMSESELTKFKLEMDNDSELKESVEISNEEVEEYEEDEWEYLEKHLGEHWIICRCYDSDDEPVIGIPVLCSGGYEKVCTPVEEFLVEYAKAVQEFKEKVGKPMVYLISEIG